MICQHCPVAHRLIGSPSRSSYFHQRASCRVGQVLPLPRTCS
jgi:hypothetical protein